MQRPPNRKILLRPRFDTVYRRLADPVWSPWTDPMQDNLEHRCKMDRNKKIMDKLLVFSAVAKDFITKSLQPEPLLQSSSAVSPTRDAPPLYDFHPSTPIAEKT
ncbi:hypothetical protein TI39_contig4503g00001 [Zymoseptoria brevis]|uniref:Uncharacterized protein n=1 Tax=Zymoseptoria brevis TaxID=1047168 RepID=A0A0F4G6L6_9PEZI|nr:hypothetical protein TI39_contig4503g00001 [Zymoseptoria brevis]